MFSRILCVILISHGLLAAQESPVAGSSSIVGPAIAGPVANQVPTIPTPEVMGETAVIGIICDGAPTPPAPERKLPDLVVKNTTTKKIMREEPSGVPGLQPVRKKVMLTKHLVEDPHLPEPPPPPPPADMTALAPIDQMVQFGTDGSEPQSVFVSATVYDHQRTLLRWHPNGRPEAEMTAWSNIDFNHLCGISEYMYNGRRFSLMMGIGDESTAPLGIGNENTAEMAGAAQENGSEYHPPVFPTLPTTGPDFVVTEGDTGDAQAMEIITGLHKLYKVEGARLKVAYEAREQARIEREAYLRKHPPQPKDVTTWVSEPKRIDRISNKTINPESAR